MKSYSESGIPGRIARVMYWSVRFFIRNRISRHALALTYYTLFSVVPFAALCFGIAKGFALDETLKGIVNQHFPKQQELLDWVYRFADSALKHTQGGLIAGIGVVLLIFVVGKVCANVEDTFNLFWGLPKRRNLFGRINSYVTLLMIAPILLIVLGSGTVWLRSATHTLVSSCWYWMPLLFLLKLLPFLLAWTAFSALYYWVPNTKVRLTSALFGGVIAGTVFQLLQKSLFYLQGLLAGYNAIYGSFSALLLFLLWLQWLWQIMLFGGVLSYVHQIAPSGKFELDEQQFSPREKRFYLLAITLFAVRSFAENSGGVSFREIGNRLRLQPCFIRELLDELIRCRILLESQNLEGEWVYVPACSTETFDVMTFFERLDTAGGMRKTGEYPPELEVLEQTCRALYKRAAASPENRLLEKIG